MGFLSSIFGGSSKSDSPVSLLTQKQREAQDKLIGVSLPLAESRIRGAGKSVPYNIAPLSDIQNQGIEGFRDYLTNAGPVGGNIPQLGQEHMEQTLSGAFDPVEGAYFQAFRTNLMRELEQAKDRLVGGRAGQGKLYSGGTGRAMSDLEEGGMGQIAQVLGQLQSQERQNMLQAAGGAPTFAAQMEALPGMRAQQALGIGGVLQAQQQAEYDAQRQELLRQLEDKMIPVSVASQMATTQNPYYQPTYGQTGGIMGALGPLFMAAGMSGGFGNLFGGGGGGGNIFDAAPPGGGGGPAPSWVSR